MSKFHPFEVVCRGSETQLQVGEKLYKILWRGCTIQKGNVYSVAE